MKGNFLRKRISRTFTGLEEVVLESRVPSYEELCGKFRDIHEMGLYLHIPFCEQICPYCPYNKTIYDRELASRYARAIVQEIDCYAGIAGNKPVTSFYIGGGTPTTMLDNGLRDILEHVYKRFNMQCSIHMESHPNHLSPQNIATIQSMGVKYLSMGVESLQDRHLKTLRRPYTRDEVIRTVKRVAGQGFECVNVDFIFDLPDQSLDEIEQAGHALIDMGIDQVASYPLFRFPYTQLGKEAKANSRALPTMLRRRRMLRILEGIFYDSGFERSSVWAFTRKGVSKYCSVTVPLYLGLGASGGTYLKNVFYLNTFNVEEYTRAIESGQDARALSVELSDKMQMAGWLYWRIYETRFRKSDFFDRFRKDFDTVYGKYLKPLALLGYLKDDGEEVVLTDRGTYWLHAFEDFFSIDYISKLWGRSGREPWPAEIIL
jgi:coproporphyrinogen III oxidase-like Fe-S oxidoreductase